MSKCSGLSKSKVIARVLSRGTFRRFDTESSEQRHSKLPMLKSALANMSSTSPKGLVLFFLKDWYLLLRLMSPMKLTVIITIVKVLFKSGYGVCCGHVEVYGTDVQEKSGTDNGFNKPNDKRHY